jgi:signal transduction histidine kinase
VLNNLITNAIKYQNLNAESLVKIKTSRNSNELSIEIQDNGIGIADELQPKIFEMFFRATELSSGSGLGLYIVKEIIDKMNGTISVKSTLSEGTVFRINLKVNE